MGILAASRDGRRLCGAGAAFLLIAALTTIAIGTTPAAGQATGSISGTVIAADTSLPLPGTEVCANGTCTLADSTGAYTITGLAAPAEYDIFAVPTSTDYSVEFFDDTPFFFESTPVPIHAGQTTSNIDFSLDPTGTVSGVVLDAATGLPRSEIEVCLSDNPTENPHPCGISDAAGSYTITGVQTSAYQVQFRAEFGLEYDYKTYLDAGIYVFNVPVAPSEDVVLLDVLLVPTTDTCFDQQITVDLGAGESPTIGDDVIAGTPGPDVINGLAGNDIICGRGGDDVINGGSGDDRVKGGDGNDSLFGLDGDDLLGGGPDNDVIVGGTGWDSVNGAGGDDVVNGGADNDYVSGGTGNDELFGQGGNDTVRGDEGDDLALGGDGDDRLKGGEGNDILNGGLGDDDVEGEEGNDTIFGLAGADNLEGGEGDDSIFGQLGNDDIDGGAGDDQLLGNEGDDDITDPAGTNVMNGGADNDTLTGGTGNDDIFGDGNLTQAGDDIINGGPGLDLLIGFAGADTITSDDGEADTVNGGPDVDACTTDGTDTVYNCP